MPAGQSYGVYRLIKNAASLTAKFAGASEKSADEVGVLTGVFAATLTALFTADVAGGAAVALEVANKEKKGGPDAPSP